MARSQVDLLVHLNERQHKPLVRPSVVTYMLSWIRTCSLHHYLDWALSIPLMRKLVLTDAAMMVAISIALAAAIAATPVFARLISRNCHCNLLVIRI